MSREYRLAEGAQSLFLVKSTNIVFVAVLDPSVADDARMLQI
jgi:hypothetical protein